MIALNTNLNSGHGVLYKLSYTIAGKYINNDFIAISKFKFRMTSDGKERVCITNIIDLLLILR